MFGGDASGAMYEGLQIAASICFDGLSATYICEKVSLC
jgi:hypothetical protein